MAPLPRIACFHGGGSNGAIFEVQCARLQDLLKTELEFVFFDAPFVRSAGPGVLPAFETYAPFRTWFKTDADGKLVGDGSGYDAVGTDGIERVRRLMHSVAGNPANWVGVMGFSQGTRVVSGMLLDQQRRATAGIKNDFSFKFGVLCMGGAAPMESHITNSQWNAATTRTGTDMNAGNKQNEAMKLEIELIRLPTLHLHGLKDVNLMPGREQLATFFDRSTTTLFEIDYHHAMPWNRPDLNQFAKLVKEIYEHTK